MEFLEELAKHYTIGVFTASTQEYADAVITQLDPDEKFVSLRLYRQHCTPVNGKYYYFITILIFLVDYFVKDLSMFTNIP